MRTFPAPPSCPLSTFRRGSWTAPWPGTRETGLIPQEIALCQHIHLCWYYVRYNMSDWADSACARAGVPIEVRGLTKRKAVGIRDEYAEDF